MNYEKSSEIVDKVKAADKILINCHRSPDPDSVGSATALYQVLSGLGKKPEMICPSALPDDVKFLPLSKKVKRVDFKTFDFNTYDLFICLDSGSADMVTGQKDIALPRMPILVIDHHKTNKAFGEINLVDEKVSSTAEVLYLVFEDWQVKIEKEVAQSLLTGILADTGVFEYGGVTARTLGIAQKLMELGANKDEIILNVFHSYPFSKVKFWGEIIQRAKVDEKGFVWAAVPYDVFKKYGSPISAKESAASLVFQSVDDTDFGMVMVEEEEKVVSISFRGRTEFDVSKIAEALGGGGHRSASGAKVYGQDFDTAVKTILKAAHKVIDEKA